MTGSIAQVIVDLITALRLMIRPPHLPTQENNPGAVLAHTVNTDHITKENLTLAQGATLDPEKCHIVVGIGRGADLVHQDDTGLGTHIQDHAHTVQGGSTMVTVIGEKNSIAAILAVLCHLGEGTSAAGKIHNLVGAWVYLV